MAATQAKSEIDAILDAALDAPGEAIHKGAAADWLRDRGCDEHAVGALLRLLPVQSYDPQGDSRLQNVEYLVEASHCERGFLKWENRNREPEDNPQHLVWHEEQTTCMATVGHIAGLPVVVVFTFARLNGHPVAFFQVVSRACDTRLVDLWLDRHCRRADGERPGRTSAMNFHLCIEHCRGE